MATLEKRLKCCKFSGGVAPTPTPTTAKISLAVDWQDMFRYNSSKSIREFEIGDNSIADIKLFADDESVFGYTVSHISASITGEGYISILKFDLEIDLSSVVFGDDSKELGFMVIGVMVLTLDTGKSVEAPASETSEPSTGTCKDSGFAYLHVDTLELTSCWEA